MIFGILIYLLLFLVLFSLTSKINNFFKGVLSLLWRLHPLSVIANEPLFQYLTQHEYDKSSNDFSVFTSIIHNSQDSIFCLNKNETIEMANESVSSLFGYAPGSLLGQHISSVLPLEQCHDIFQQMILMREGQCVYTYERMFKALQTLNNLCQFILLF
jgi:PAS domain-containing protein